MRLPVGSVLREGLSSSFSEPPVLRAYAATGIVLAAALAASWPRGSWEAALRTGYAGDTFAVVAVFALFAVLFVAGRLGAEDFSGAPADLAECVALAGVPVRSLVLGRALFGALHSLFLAALCAPFLVAARGVSGARPGALPVALAVLFLAAWSARMYGLLLLSLMGPHRIVRGAFLLLGVTVWLVAVSLAAPGMSPVVALVSARDAAGLSGVPVPLAAADLGAGALLAAASGFVLARARARGIAAREDA